MQAAITATVPPTTSIWRWKFNSLVLHDVIYYVEHNNVNKEVTPYDGRDDF